MPPFYPNDFPNNYLNNYQYYNQYNQNSYNSNPPQQGQPVPPFPQIQINIPPHPLHTQQRPQYQQQQQQQQQQQPHVQVQTLSQPQYQYQHQPHPQSQLYSMPQHHVQSVNQQHYQYNQQPQYAPQYIPQPIRQQQPQPVLNRQQEYSSMAPQQPIRAQQPMTQQKFTQSSQNISHQQVPPTPTPPKISEVEEPEYAILLLGLADEYLEAATKLSGRPQEYYKLTATALGCIQSVLINFKLPALREVQVSLKYAQILYNETENFDEAESILTKAVEICERLKFVDLKYAAQLLLGRVLHKTSPRAALKELERMIDDIEAYKHVAWEYAFRLQHAMFSINAGQASDIHAAIVQFERLGSAAKRSGDNTVTAFAAVLEAFTHLRSSSVDAVEASQTALATARSMQLNTHVLGNSQIMLMMDFVDLCASIKAFDITQIEQKRRAMQQALFQAIDSKDGWRNDGLMFISLRTSSLRNIPLQEGGIITDRNNTFFLALQWLSQDEVENMAYLLCGISAAMKNAGDSGKAEKFLDEGLDLLGDIMDNKRPFNSAGDMAHIRRQLTKCHFLLERAFLQCSKGQWNKAEATVETINNIANELEAQFPVDMRSLVDYLRGSISQGTGNLTKALEIYNMSHLQIRQQGTMSTQGRPSTQSSKQNDVVRDVSILACINTIFIIQNPLHPQHHRLQHCVATLDHVAQSSPNKTIRAAYNFVLASLPNSTILKMKHYLSNTLNAAQAICNAQITTLCLVTMQEKLFRGVVGGQAVKCARAATHQARRLNEPLWISVATGLESESLSIHGMNEDAMRKREEAERMKHMLPEAVRAVHGRE